MSVGVRREKTALHFEIEAVVGDMHALDSTLRKARRPEIHDEAHERSRDALLQHDAIPRSEPQRSACGLARLRTIVQPKAGRRGTVTDDARGFRPETVYMRKIEARITY